MKIFSKFVSLLVSFFLLLPVLAIAAPVADLNHKIAGYGAVKGDLYAPSSSCIHNNQLFVLDNFGISIFDLSNKQLVNQFKTYHISSDSSAIWNDPTTWIDFITSFSKGLLGLMEGLLLGTGGLGSISSPGLVQVKADLYFDSTGRLFLFSQKGIQQIDPGNGTLISTKPILELDAPNPEEKTRTTVASKLINDKIFILQSKSIEEDYLSNLKYSIVIMTLNGEIEKKIDLIIENEDLTIMPSDFVYLPDLDVFGLIAIDLYTEEPTLPFLFFDQNGMVVPCSGKDLKIIPTSLEFQQPDKVVLSGMSMPSLLDFSGKTSLLTLLYEQNEEGAIELKLEKKLPHKNFGMSSVDLFVNEKEISIITTGTLETPMWEARLFYVHDEKVVDRIGTSFYGEGQIFGSIAYAIDKDGSLYETSFTNSIINKYDKNGKYLSSIQMDLKAISSMMGILTIFPTILDMFIDEDYLYLNNLLPGGISRYSFKEDSWEQIYTDDPETMLDSFNLLFTMKMEDDTIFLLDSSKLNDGAPNLSFLDENFENASINLENSPEFDTTNPPVFMGFSMTETEYLFLDSIHQNIWIYNRLTRKYVNQITLPKNPQGFYSSFDLYPDESLIVSDVITGELLHIAKTGELLETIGKKGEVAIGTTKEAYSEKKDQFEMPIRVKVSNNQLYVSDLLNCRYHIISLEKSPTIQWEKETISITSFSVFSEEIIDLSFTVAPKTDFALSLSVSEPWLQIKSESFKAADGKVSVKILGEKLSCWKANEGFIQITCKDYPNLSKKISITVNAIGNVVELTIGSQKAKMNGKEMLIDQASIPTIVKGRTFVGVRLMGEVVFNNLAKIDYDAKTQTVYYELGNKKIELYIGKNYALVNGNKVTLDVPPFIKNGRTFVPLRFVSENLEASVAFNAKTQTITISYPGK